MGKKQMTLQDIKTELAASDGCNLYFFYGPDEHTKSFYEKAFRKKICGDDTLAYYKFGDNFSLEDLADEIMAVPLFGGNKFILVKNSGLFKAPGEKQSGDVLQRFTEITDEIPESVTVFFSETVTDKTNLCFKEIISKSASYEAVIPTEDVLEKFVYAIAKKNGCNFQKDAVSLLVEGIGEDPMALSNETEKLCLACEDGEIDRSLVRECCTLSVAANIFDLTDSLCKQDKTDAMSITEALVNSGENVQKILIMTGSHFAKLFYIKEMWQKGKNPTEIAGILGNKPYYVNKLINQCRNVPIERLKNNVDFCFKADCDIKAGNLSDRDALDLLIMST